jgi:hypothetical protein
MNTMTDEKRNYPEIELRQWCLQTATPIALNQGEAALDVAREIYAWITEGDQEQEPSPLKAVA